MNSYCIILFIRLENRKQKKSLNHIEKKIEKKGELIKPNKLFRKLFKKVNLHVYKWFTKRKSTIIIFFI